jgi:hypothetical protein
VARRWCSRRSTSNGDGAVTLEEMEGAREARFAEADANGDGVLDRDELLAGASERMARGSTG